tara:strand:- start:4895 stop:5029 length:135 start_codon:yes stop_codon:yes gene_type:complete
MYGNNASMLGTVGWISQSMTLEEALGEIAIFMSIFFSGEQRLIL